MAGDNFAVMLPRIRNARLEYKKYLNFLIALGERRRQATVVCSLPFDLTVDLSTACQLRCPYCVTGTRTLDRPIMHLSRETNDRILASVGDSAFLIWYFACGEPLLNPRHAELIAEAAKREVFSVISTNLSMPLSDAKIDALLLSGLGMLCVALDGATPETYVRYRRGGDFHLVVDNLRRLVRRKRELGLERPILEWRFLIFRHNQHEVGQVRKMAEEIGVDSLDFYWGGAPANAGPDSVQALIPPVHGLEPWSPITSTGLARADSTLRRWLGEGILRFPKETPSRLVRKKCDWHYYGVTIHPDGRVGPCCAATASATDFAELPQPERFPQMWNGAPFQRARRMFSAGEAAADLVCARCPAPPVMDFHFRKCINGILANAPDWALAVLASDPDSFFSEIDFWNLPTAARVALARRADFGHFPRIAEWLERDAAGDTPRHEQVRRILALLGPTPDFLRSPSFVDVWHEGTHPVHPSTWVGWAATSQPPQRFFATSAPLLRFDRTRGFAGIEAGPGTTLQIRDGEMLVSHAGGDPNLLLPMLHAPECEELYLRVQMVLSAPGIAQIFYVPPGETWYCESNSRIIELEPGLCDLFVRIPTGDLQKPLRLDPVNRPETVVIRSIEVRAARRSDAAAEARAPAQDPSGSADNPVLTDQLACAARE